MRGRRVKHIPMAGAAGMETFQKRENRDARARALQDAGYDVSLSSARGQLMHPEYIEDWPGSIESGPGNEQYRTMFSVVYSVTWTRPGC